jgi:hypothetical protein
MYNLLLQMHRWCYVSVKPLGAVVPEPDLQSVCNADNQESTWIKSGGSKFKLEWKKNDYQSEICKTH